MLSRSNAKTTNVLQKIVREIRRPFRPRPLEPEPLSDQSPWIREIVAKVAPFTMTSKERIACLCSGVEYIVRAGVPGAFVECGVWRGGSMMAAALALRHLGVSDREFYLFDTFSGMTAPTDFDRRSADGVSAEHVLTVEGTGWDPASSQDVRRNLESTGYPASRLTLVQGSVEDTLPEKAPEQIALLRLDTDWYESTWHELVHLYPRLSSRGVLVIDDYGCWEGSKIATDKYLSDHKVPIFLHRIDSEGRVAIKP